MSDKDSEYFRTSDYNKFLGEILNKKKKKGSVDKSDISRFINDSDLANEYSRHYSG